MSEVVVVPAWRRGDFLSACFQRLLIADDGRQHYLIALDRGYSREVATVTNDFQSRLGSRAEVRRRYHQYRGNSYNLLTSYSEALRRDPERVYLVEEDIFVAADFYDFHRRSAALVPEAFAVSACRNQQFATDPPDDPTRVYKHTSYQSLGVSFAPDRLAVVVGHARQPYFRHPVAYCKRLWPHSAIPAGNAEQDGLIHRIIEEHSYSTVYPFTPRAYHAGFVGYHRHGATLTGPLDERAARLLAMTEDELNVAAYSFPDHRTVDLDAPRAPVSEVASLPALV